MHAKKKEKGKKIDPGRARLGKKMDQLVVYTSLHIVQDYLPGLTVASMITLELSGGEQETELVLVNLISTTLQEILIMRILKTNIRRNLIRTRTTLEAKCQISICKNLCYEGSDLHEILYISS